MQRTIVPIWQRLRHLQSPRLFQVKAKPVENQDTPTSGQRLAEQVAASVGSWWFLGGQAFFLLLWLIYNSLVFTRHFDSFPYILLNLLLSFQAAFTGPVLLIAANVGALRDHAQADRIEQLSKQSEELATQNRELVERLVSLEEMLDTHVSKSLRAHTEELRNLSALLHEVHASVTSGGQQSIAAALTAAQSDGAGESATSSASAAIAAPRRRRVSGSQS